MIYYETMFIRVQENDFIRQYHFYIHVVTIHNLITIKLI